MQFQVKMSFAKMKVITFFYQSLSTCLMIHPTSCIDAQFRGPSQELHNDPSQAQKSKRMIRQTNRLTEELIDLNCRLCKGGGRGGGGNAFGISDDSRPFRLTSAAAAPPTGRLLAAVGREELAANHDSVIRVPTCG